MEFDAYRCDLEYYNSAPKNDANQMKHTETQVTPIIKSNYKVGQFISLNFRPPPQKKTRTSDRLIFKIS